MHVLSFRCVVRLTPRGCLSVETDHKVDEEDEQLFLDDENMLSAKVLTALVTTVVQPCMTRVLPSQEFAAVAPSKQVVGVTLQVVQVVVVFFLFWEKFLPIYYYFCFSLLCMRAHSFVGYPQQLRKSLVGGKFEETVEVRLRMSCALSQHTTTHNCVCM